jgi:flagellar FliL protein
MAEQGLDEEDLDLDTDKAAPAKKGGMGKVIALVVGGILITGLSVGLTLFILKSNTPDEGFNFDGAIVDPEAELAGGGKAKSDGGKGAGKKGKVPTKPAIYLPLDPPFTVNFETAGNVHFLQISVEAMARDQMVIDEMTNHLPLIRNNLLLLFSGLTYDDIDSREDKENLRQKAREVVQQALRQETRKAKVEDVYFTSFVMQ